MYDTAVTSRMVTAASDARVQEGLPPLVYHSLAEIEFATGYLDDIYDPEEERTTRPLTPEELAFIANERQLCALDFRTYWAPNYAWIVNWETKDARFQENIAQSIIIDCWAEDERNGHAIWMQQLKARRLGASTAAELAITHRFQFQEKARCVLASADPDKTVEMAGMMKYALDHQPWWLKPKATKIHRGIPIEFAELHNTLAIQAGNQFTGVARGSSPNIVHLSELCEWRDAANLIEGALLRAILDTPDTFGILESTAKGPGWWKRFWQSNKREWDKGTGRIRPIFLPWFVGTDIYPTPADRMKRPMPHDWIPSDISIQRAERARASVLADPLLFEHLAHGSRDWQMSRDMMWFYEIEYERSREDGTLNIFLAEVAGDDTEAFQSYNVALIDTEILLNYQSRTRVPEVVYTIAGPDIPQSLIAPKRYWRTDVPIVNISTAEILPRYAVTYQLIPITFEGYSTFDESLKLLVWEEPVVGHVYGIGVDCAEGIGQDNSCMEVLREATPTREPGQVAEWVSNTVTAFQLWPLIAAIGTWYSTPHPMTLDRRQCRLAIETWANGSSAQHELQKRGWVNFHPWMYAGDSRVRRRPGDTAKVGVMTNAWFRSSMQDMFLTVMSEEAIDLPSPYLIEELTTLERVQGTRKAEAEDGAKDDRFMGLGIILYSLHMNKPPSQQYQRKRLAHIGVNADEQVLYPIWTPPSDSVAQPWRPGSPGMGVSVKGNGRVGTLMPYQSPIRTRGGR